MANRYQLPSRGITVDLHIKNVDIEGPYIKIFAQTDKTNVFVVEAILSQLQEVFESTELKPKTMNDITIGLICCAKMEEDIIYYRAKVVGLEHIRPYKVTVFFIDLGNVAQVKCSDIRLLPKLEQMLDDKRVPPHLLGASSVLMELKGLADELYLSGVARKPNTQWDDETLAELRKELRNKEKKCTIHQVGSKKIVKCLEPDTDPAQLLILLGKCVSLPQHHLEEYLKKRYGEEQAPLPQQINTSSKLNMAIIPPRVVVATHVQPPPQSRVGLRNRSQQSLPLQRPRMLHATTRTVPNQPILNRHGGVHVRPPGVPGMQIRRPEASKTVPVQNLQFPDILSLGSIHDIFVSHFEDGPHCFSVQLKTVTEEVLSRMMLELNSIDPEPITAPLNPGSICVGRYSGDKTLCRAIVTDVMDDKVKLYLADFGFTEEVIFSEVYQIPPQFVIPKVMSHCFSLANIKGVVYTEQEKLIFKDLVAKNNCLMIVTPPEGNPTKQYCELFIGSNNIKYKLNMGAAEDTGLQSQGGGDHRQTNGFGSSEPERENRFDNRTNRFGDRNNSRNGHRESDRGFNRVGQNANSQPPKRSTMAEKRLAKMAAARPNDNEGGFQNRFGQNNQRLQNSQETRSSFKPTTNTVQADDDDWGSKNQLGSLVMPTLNYPADTTISSQLVWYISPSQFYLQPKASNPEFRAMMQAMQAIVRTGTVKQMSDLSVGDSVIARFKADKVLYRAIVQDAGFAPKVQYVDYGNVDAVDSGNVWAMEQEFAKLPIQAINCCLDGVQPTGEAWPKPDSTDLDSHFEAETLDCTVLKKVEGEGDPRYLVKLVKQGEDVAQKIIKAGFAVANSDAVGVPSEL